jgi:cell division protein FtsB
MTTYGKISHKRLRKNRGKQILGGIVVAGLIISLGQVIYIKKLERAVQKTQMQIELVSGEKQNLEQQLPVLKATQNDLNQELNRLKTVIWRYQPVVIPPSMQ